MYRRPETRCWVAGQVFLQLPFLSSTISCQWEVEAELPVRKIKSEAPALWGDKSIDKRSIIFRPHENAPTVVFMFWARFDSVSTERTIFCTQLKHWPFTETPLAVHNSTRKQKKKIKYILQTK